MRNKKLIALLIFSVSILLSVSFLVFKDFFKQAASLGLAGLFIINFVSSASFFMPFPAFLTVISGGSIYPPVMVAFVASLGATAGDTVGYLLGLSGRHLADHKLAKNRWFILFEKIFKKHASWLLFLFAFIPNFVFDAVGLIAGIFRYSPLKFFLFVFLGRFLRYFIFAQLGSLL